ncbi:hypothetical protein BC941DRAFT_439831 [Chlamydoabsidia padenii]|nr:hypothetical protein BC941DRAFT_439831 [Chlamydoabsidia padenii]
MILRSHTKKKQRKPQNETILRDKSTNQVLLSASLTKTTVKEKVVISNSPTIKHEESPRPLMDQESPFVDDICSSPGKFDLQLDLTDDLLAPSTLVYSQDLVKASQDMTRYADDFLKSSQDLTKYNANDMAVNDMDLLFVGHTRGPAITERSVTFDDLSDYFSSQVSSTVNGSQSEKDISFADILLSYD